MSRQAVIDYQRRKERSRSRQAEQSAAGRELAPLPAIRDPQRRGRCRASLRAFMETYLLAMFSDPKTSEHWPWSQDQIAAIALAEEVILQGKRFAVAMPRGGFKSGLLTAACLWGILNGYAKWICVLAASNPKAKEFGADMQMILETNDLLADDYPEVCYPIARLENIGNRQRGQTYMGKPTRIKWLDTGIVMPDIPGSRASQARITWTGLDSRGIRGQKKVLPDGRQVRPDVVLIDDPQTRDSAISAKQTGKRMSLLNGDVMKMGPTGGELAALMAVTVIAPNDLADQVLKDPQWRGLRTKMLKCFPLHFRDTPAEVPHEDYWDQYGILYRNGQYVEADQLYAGHRCLDECRDRLDEARPCAACPRRMQCMDAEAVVSWKYRKYRHEQSALQRAMHLYFDDPAAFRAEMQQEPEVSVLGAGKRLQPGDICRRLSGLERGVLPPEATHLTSFVDVHNELLYWMVCAWRGDFTGWIVDYGAFPEQPVPFFGEVDPPRPMSSLFPGLGKEGLVIAGLERLCGALLSRQFAVASGGVRQIERLFVDANFDRKCVVAAKRRLNRGEMWLRHGVGITSAKRPIALYKNEPGWLLGDGWYVPPIQRGNEFPHVIVDVNHWKTWCFSHLDLAAGEPGSIILFGRPGDEARHQHLAGHLAGSQYYKIRSGTFGNTVWEWQDLPGGGADVHWWDCLVGCAAAASMVGCRPASADGAAQSERTRWSMSELAARAKERQSGKK